MPGADGFVNTVVQAASAPHTSPRRSSPPQYHHVPETHKAQDRHALERLRLLCQLQLDPAMWLPELFAGLRNVIPALAASVIWNSDASGACVATDTVEHVALSQQAQSQASWWPRVQAQVCACSGKLTCTVLAGADAALRAAQFAHDPHFVQHTVEHRALTVSLCAAHRFIGCIVLYRSASATAFSTHEQAVLLSLAPALAAALHAQPTAPASLYVPSQTGTLLLDDAGRVLHACSHAARLLSLATVDMACTAHTIDSLWAQLRAAQPTAGCDHATTRGELHNPCGQFVFRMQRLNAPADPTGAGATLVTLTHYQPLALKILRQCEQFALPPKQTQIAVQLVHGESYDAIATQLDISAHTVIDHTRKLQTRLAVRNRSELVAKLVAG